jgi:hypothetical protein
MTSPSGAESPSPVGPFLVWQEPHPIFYAELCWREHGDHATLEKFRDIVFQTADFMASYATWDTNTSRYVLGPTLQCAQEIFPKGQNFEPHVRADLLALGVGNGAEVADAARSAAREKVGRRFERASRNRRWPMANIFSPKRRRTATRIRNGMRIIRPWSAR